MTHDHRNDPRDPAHDHADDTRVVERQTYVEREHEREPDPGYVPPAAGGGQVNVSTAGSGSVAT